MACGGVSLCLRRSFSPLSAPQMLNPFPVYFSWTSVASTKVFKNAPNHLLVFEVSKLIIRACSSSSINSQEAISNWKIASYSHIKLEETIDVSSGKLRLDSWISSQINGISRSRVQSSISSGLVSVKSHVVDKASYILRGGNKVDCKISKLQPRRSGPEALPSDIDHEEHHVLVVDKHPLVENRGTNDGLSTGLNESFNHRICSLNTIIATLSQVRQAHAYGLKAGLLKQSSFATKLLSVYANHQCFCEVDLLLDELPEPDLFLFTTLINASTRIDNFNNVLKLLAKMLALHLLPDTYTLPSAVRACAGLSALKLGQQIHGFGLSSGLVVDSFVKSSLFHMYMKCNDLKYAQNVFETMVEPNVISWSALAAGYAKKGDVANANKVFNDMGKLGIEPNMVSWNGMIAGFNQSGHFLEAILMFQRMHLDGFKCDGISISSVLAAVGDLEDSKVGVQVHSYAIKIGLISDKCVVSSLVDMYGKCGLTLEMLRIFESMDQKDVAICNAVLAGLSRNGMVDMALQLFKTFQGQEVELNVVSWTSIIACCSQNGKDIEALKLFRKMQMVGMIPNRVTIPCLLPACAHIAALAHGKAAHCFALRREFSDDVHVGSALINMYSNCGRIQVARRCFDRLPIRNLPCWNAMIDGYALHGKPKEAIGIFHLMQRNGQKPDFISFTSLLSACSQSGLADLGLSYFNSMSADYGIEARMEHYACVVSLLGRAGKLEDAYSMVKKMPFKPDACVWGALLSSCRVHNNMSLGEVVAHSLFQLEPENPGNYVLLSNIYAARGKWNEVDKVRDMMKDAGLRKNPGCSWIEVKNKVHMLLAGDKSHPQMVQIMEKLSKFNMEMRKAGYLPDTEFVLQDVEEQEKEHILCGHSEKLAVVLGVLNTNPGSPLTVMKNLRICGDCHAVIKFISSFEGREIFVRDTNRFHHFKEGLCSCGDFW